MDAVSYTHLITEKLETEAEQREIGIQKYVYVPDQFAVYTDGEPHRLMYAADTDYYHYCTFKNISLKAHGFESISLPLSLANTEKQVYILEKGDLLESLDWKHMDRDLVINDSAYFSSDGRDVYSLRTPGMYMFHIWTETYDGEIHTLTLKNFADILKIGGSITSDFEDIEILEDGSTRYTCAYKDDREYTGDEVPYYGKAVVRLKDGRAWCGIFAEKDHKDGPRMATYILKQSVQYTEEDTNE